MHCRSVDDPVRGNHNMTVQTGASQECGPANRTARQHVVTVIVICGGLFRAHGVVLGAPLVQRLPQRQVVVAGGAALEAARCQGAAEALRDGGALEAGVDAVVPVRGTQQRVRLPLSRAAAVADATPNSMACGGVASKDSAAIEVQPDRGSAEMHMARQQELMAWVMPKPS